MSVEIINCNNTEYWYYGKIGQTFEVNFPIEDCYRVWVGSASYCVLKTDCKII